MLPPKSSIRLCSVARHRPKTLKARPDCRDDLVTKLRHGEDDRHAHDDSDEDRRHEATVGRAEMELARVQGLADEGKADQQQHRLDDRLRGVIERCRGHRLRGRCPHPLKEAEVDPDPPGGAGHGQVDELDRGLQEDAGEQRERSRDRSTYRHPRADEAGLCEKQRDHDPGRIGLLQLLDRSCRTRSRPAWRSAGTRRR